MRYEGFIERVQERSGVASPEEAERIAQITLEVLGERLKETELRLVASRLPEPLAEALRRGRPAGSFDAVELYRRIGERERVPLGFAVEHAAAVCRVLAETLDPDTCLRLQLHVPLPESRVAEVLPERHRRVTPPGRGHTLADGRPGSRRPLSEAEARPAHRESVVESENPHASSKLSSASGTATDQRGDSLAVGRTGSKRPLSDGGDT
ncbi:MAG: DUF2267 domain-containing protein [Deltaproteobacteria bacterium]|nr:DUF2267 domain-containing protein [Deltaproteobacteria bacterium]